MSASSFLLWKFVIEAAARLLSRYHSAQHKLNICQPICLIDLYAAGVHGPLIKELGNRGPSKQKEIKKLY
jgi:hypothetical protein